jgi:hypothetical protein
MGLPVALVTAQGDRSLRVAVRVTLRSEDGIEAGGSALRTLQAGELRARLLQDRQVWIGVPPKREERLILLACLGDFALHGIGPRQCEVAERHGGVYGQSAPLSPAAGLAVLNAPSAIAVDPSGNVWTANAGDNSASEIVGIAGPTVQPLAAVAGP